MSRNLTYLARQDRQHYVVCTEDGSKVFLHWRHARVALAPTELLAVTDFLESAVPRLTPGSLLGNALYCVLHDEEGNYEVWLLGIGLYLGPAEFNRFLRLVISGASAIRMSVDRAILQASSDARLN